MSLRASGSITICDMTLANRGIPTSAGLLEKLSRAGFLSKHWQKRPLFVPGAMPALDLLMKMQATRIHLALVIDEYGGTDGLVSIEDLVEEIVGDIDDEFDVEDEQYIRKEGERQFVVRGATPIADFMIKEPVAVLVTAGQDEVAEVVAKYNLLAAPVVDDERRLVGIVTVDDAIDTVIPTSWKRRMPRVFSR